VKILNFKRLSALMKSSANISLVGVSHMIRNVTFFSLRGAPPNLMGLGYPGGLPIKILSLYTQYSSLRIYIFGVGCLPGNIMRLESRVRNSSKKLIEVSETSQSFQSLKLQVCFRITNLLSLPSEESDQSD
jgi:hypothetical protein